MSSVNSDINSYNLGVWNEYQTACKEAKKSDGEAPLIGVACWGEERTFFLWKSEGSCCCSPTKMIFKILSWLGSYEFFRNLGIGIDVRKSVIVKLSKTVTDNPPSKLKSIPVEEKKTESKVTTKEKKVLPPLILADIDPNGDRIQKDNPQKIADFLKLYKDEQKLEEVRQKKKKTK